MKKKNERLTSISFSNNDNNIVLCYNDGKLRKADSISKINNQNDTIINTNGKRLSDIEKLKMYPSYEFGWKCNGKSYITKLGCIHEITNGTLTDTILDLSNSLMSVCEESNKNFFTNMQDDMNYSTNNYRTLNTWRTDNGVFSNDLCTNKNFLSASDKLEIKPDSTGNRYAYFECYKQYNNSIKYNKFLSVFLGNHSITQCNYNIDFDYKTTPEFVFFDYKHRITSSLFKNKLITRKDTKVTGELQFIYQRYWSDYYNFNTTYTLKSIFTTAKANKYLDKGFQYRFVNRRDQKLFVISFDSTVANYSGGGSYPKW